MIKKKAPTKKTPAKPKKQPAKAASKAVKKTAVKKEKAVKAVKSVKAPEAPDSYVTSVARLIAQAAYDTKALDIRVLDLQKLPAFADYFVICSGSSDRHVQAIGERIQKALKEKGIYPIGVEGVQTGHWVLVDCGGVLAHIFYEETREFYALEKLWGDAQQVKFDLK